MFITCPYDHTTYETTLQPADDSRQPTVWDVGRADDRCRKTERDTITVYLIYFLLPVPLVVTS